MKRLGLFRLTLVLVLLAASTALWATGAQEKPGQASTAAKPAGKPYWIADGMELSYWCTISPRTTATRATHAEVDGWKEAEKYTGIKIKWIHAPEAQAKEPFNLMIASGDLPDIISWNWFADFPGGPEKAIADKVILKLNDIASKSAPNLSKFLNARPDIVKQVVTDAGSLYLVPFLRTWIKDKSEDWERYFLGAQVRQDWLTEMNLAMPKTMEDWEKVLTAFKGRGANIIPLVALPTESTYKTIGGLRHFMSAWGMDYEFYQVGGKVKFGAAEPEYLEYLTIMNRWYKNGLLDKDWVSREYNGLRSLIAEGRVGSYWGRLNAEMGGFTPLGQKNNPKFTLMDAPWPYAKDGKSYNMDGSAAAAYQGSGAAITAKSKHPAEAMKWLDFWWSETGHVLGNFGIEGLTYKMVNGFPTYTELVTKNPDGLSVVNALSKYAADGAGGRMWVQDARYWQQMMSLDAQTQSGKMLQATADHSHVLPLVTPTTDESRELAKLLSEINTYRDEMFAKFVVGAEPLANFTAYIQKINSMGLSRAIQIQQGALDRYEKRPLPKF
jgi:putative aldouronate transport system substrate-binding protein